MQTFLAHEVLPVSGQLLCSIRKPNTTTQVMIPSIPRTISIFCVAAVACASTSFAIVTPVSSSISLQADSRASSSVSTVTDTDSSSQLATLNPLSASVRAESTDGAASVVSTASASATWVNATQGAVSFNDFGWVTEGVSGGSAILANGLDWSYTFASSTAGVFTLNYDISATGSNLFGLNGAAFSWNGSQSFMNINTSGAFSRNFGAGETVTVILKNNANISGSLGTRNALMDGDFGWSMAVESVPDTGTTVALLGLALTGLAFVRRRIA